MNATEFENLAAALHAADITTPGVNKGTLAWHGRTYRVRTVPDDFMTINDYDADGTVSEFVEYRLFWNYPPQRPPGFDGRAVKISLRGGYVWWQPSPDAVYPDDAAFRKDQQRIANLLEYGWLVVFVELLDGSDAYGRDIVREYATCGGIEWDALSDASVAADIVGNLIDEIEDRLP